MVEAMVVLEASREAAREVAMAVVREEPRALSREPLLLPPPAILPPVPLLLSALVEDGMAILLRQPGAKTLRP